MKWITTCMLAAALLAPVAGQAQSPAAERLEGIWIFRVLIPGQRPIYTGTARFHADGKLSGPPIDQRNGEAVGDWIRTGPREFAFTFVANALDETGAYRSTNRVRGKLTLSEDGLTATGRTVVDIMNSAGDVTLTRSSTFAGVRVLVDPI